MTTVNLQPGETKTISFTYTPTVAKQYTVEVDGLMGHFTASLPPGAADIRAVSLAISPGNPDVGEQVIIYVDVKNFGTAAGSRDIVVTVT
jgi:hypothetical protein